ncbi:MAG: hypothetical protein RLZ04_1337 [Actinomycetota bacterium]
MSRTARSPLTLTAPAAIAALVALAPVWYLFDRAFSRGFSHVLDELWRRRTLDLVLRSGSLALVVTVACTVIGTLGAWLVTRTDLPGRSAWRVVLLLPLAIPSYLSAFAWVSWRPDLAGFGGAALVLTLTSYPYVMLPVMAALVRLDPAQDDVARSLGVDIPGVLRRVTLPALRPAIASGALLVALYVLSDFGAVAAMRYEAFTWVVYGAYRAGFDPTRAAILANVLVAIATVLVLAEGRVRGRAASRIGGGSARRSRPLPLGAGRPFALGACAIVAALALAFPAWRIATWIGTSSTESIAWSDVLDPLATTLRYSVLAAVATTLLAFPVGLVAARYPTRPVQLLERSTYVAHALPGIVIAISMVFVGVRLLRPWYLEVPLLVLAYVVLFLPLAVGSVRTAVEQTPVRLEETARSLGSSRRTVLRRITLPLAMPGVASGAALVMLTAMKELPVTLILRPAGDETLATRLWSMTSVSDYADAAPYAVAIVVFASIPTAVLSRRGPEFRGST